VTRTGGVDVPARRPLPALALAAAIILAGGMVSVAVNWPGHLSPDSLWQLAQGRSGVYNSWHPPVMAWLLGLADGVIRGAPLFIAGNTALFCGGLLAFVGLEARPRLIILPLLALLMLSPLALLYQGEVWKDVLFADSALSGFAALAWASRLWSIPARRYGLIIVAFTLFTLAGLARQNGLVVPVCGALALAVIALPHASPGWGRVRAIAHGVIALALVLGSVALATFALTAHGDGKPENQNQLKRLQMYDLVGATHLDPDLSLAILHRRLPDLEDFVRHEAAPVYRAASSDNLEDLPDGEVMMAPVGDAAAQQWKALILERPWLYLRVRAGVFAATFLTPRSDRCPMFYVGVDGADPERLRELKMQTRFDDRDDWENDYANALLRTPVFSHLFYAGLLVILLGITGRRWLRGERPPEAPAVLAMGSAALLFAASFFIVSGSCDYRYLYFLDVAAMAVLVREAARRPAISLTAV
jgi:hypothetical protein